MRFVLAVVIAAATSLLVWWLGRGLPAYRDSPLLAERWWRHRTRVTQVGAVATVLLVMVAGSPGIWLVPALWLGVLAARFGDRRRLLGESWSLAGYLAWNARLVAAFGGLPLLIATAPLWTAASGGSWPAATALLTLVAAAYLGAGRRVVLWLLQARPLTAAAAPAVAAAADAIAARSTAPRPDLYRTDAGGGRWYNALALSDGRQPGAVVLSSPLLATFEPAQIAAILAHEMAHLEHLTPRRVRLRGALQGLLTVAAIGLIPVARLLVEVPSWAGYAWCWAILLGLVVVASRHRRHETASDLRAVELCGDAAAVASALTLLHQLGLFPRRLEATEDASLSHPSLARRLQAIRPAGTAVDGEPAMTPLVVQGARSSQWILLDGTRISWLDGVPDGVAATPEALHEAAATSRCLAYDELSELRLAVGRGGTHELVAVLASGERVVMPLEHGTLATLQQALDLVDHRLATPELPPLLAPFARAGATLRWLALVAAPLALVLPAGLVTGVLLLVAALRPRAATLIAAATATFAAAALAWLRPAPLDDPFQPTPVVIVLVAVVGVLLAGSGIARARLSPRERIRGSRVMAVGLGIGTVLCWLWALAIAILGSSEAGAARIHSALGQVPTAVVLPACLAAVLAMMASRRARLAAVVMAALLVPACWLGRDWTAAREMVRGRGSGSTMGDEVAPAPRPRS